jgi:EAL domain-containing protein (putative c-di-GMP-specific phosphodiesterase class I)
MERRLSSALEKREIILLYQPQVEPASHRIVGAEVLIRWAPPDLGLISPSAFVPILEETGLIVEFGNGFFAKPACRENTGSMKPAPACGWP